MRRAPGPRWARNAAATGAGALPALTFPAPSWWWLAPFALVPWLLLLRTAETGRRAAVEGWLGGTAFMVAVHHWLLPNVHVFLFVLAALLGLLWAPWGWLARRLLRPAEPGPVSAPLGALLLVPSGWLVVELVRSWEYLGGPWGLLGASQWQVTPALRLASVGGVWLVSFLLVAVNTAVVLVCCLPRARAGALLALGGIAAATAAAWAADPVPRRTGEVRVAVVQTGGTPSAERRFARSAELTRELAGSRPDLVVWGESSVGFDLTARPDLRGRLVRLSAAVGAPLLVNVDARAADRPGIYKSSVLVRPDGVSGERYDKMRLVPFGEYIPARSVLGWVTSVGRAAGEDRRRGTEPVVMEAGGVRVGPLICFETAFPDMSRHLAAEGAELLVAQSSTSTFQESWAPEQHASLAALRAAETWRPVVHATLTGVSAVYGPRGEAVGRRLGRDGGATAVYPVPLAAGTSPYVRLGDWPVLLAPALLAGYGGTLAVRACRGARVEVRSPARPR
ncbi:apolipoprotein N-acyltransferase [Streptomyces sp. JJ36]|uniref:apolipoprotein N-acyltransferase n=1 Tax=Streptomyces sp. JJ36 TaxID=2736645 RepID=UPI001EFFCDF6|nr:apolipoprotein N-acyltransferase [Streptomyces sp. JJ36]MCF6524345.1 apolipoprotein N-acyltransferase [Streptomyces sp. JJ36]